MLKFYQENLFFPFNVCVYIFMCTQIKVAGSETARRKSHGLIL